MTKLQPARTLDVLDHIERRRDGEPHGPGWLVSIPAGDQPRERHFPDRKDAVAALGRAVSWRDEVVKRVNYQSARRDRAKDAGALGVRLKEVTSAGSSYLVAEATLPAAGGKKRSIRRRSVEKYGADDAIAQCCEWRFAGMRERYGDDYEFSSADELFEAVKKEEEERAEQEGAGA